MYCNTSATLYIPYKEVKTGELSYERVYLERVCWQDNENITVSADGIESADSSKVYIPANISADGRQYLPPKDYDKTPDKSNSYTYSNGSYLVIGNCPFSLTAVKGQDFKTMRRLYKVMEIVHVADKRYGNPYMHHFELEVK